MVYRVSLLIALAIILVGCSQSAFDTPIPAVLPGGDRGFGMTGYSTFTASEDTAKQEVLSRFETACGGKAEIVQWKSERADSVVGVPHVRYDAVAHCIGS